MRKTLSVIAIVLLAFPAIGQDDFGGGGFGGFEGVLTGGDIDALLGGGRGNRGNNNNPLANPEGLFLQLRDLLKAQKVPLSKDQEKTLRTFIDTETLAMRTDLETQMGNRGNRGNNNANTMTLIQDIFTIVSKNNTDLLTAMKADLTSDQVSLITKAEKDKKVCSVMMDMFNPNALQNRNNNNNNNRGNNNQNFNNLPFGIEGLDFGGGGNPQGNRGNNNNNWMQQFPDRTFCTTAASTPAERLAPISQILSKGKKPLTAEQEKKFVGLIETKVPLMQQEIRDKEPRMLSLINDINNQGNNQNRGNNNNNNNNNPPAVNPQTLRNNIVNTVLTQLGVQNNNNNNNNNRGGRGNFNQNQNQQNNQTQNNNQANANNNPAPAAATANNAAAATANNAAANNNNNNQNRGGNRGNNNNNFNPQAEIQKKTEELYDKVAAKLNPDQGVVVKKLKYDQIKAKGGVERYRGIMEQEGTPLTPEQMTQIQNLFNTQYTALRQFAEQTVQAEMDKQPTLEPPAPAPSANNNQNQNQNRPNPNNVAQNPIAQQIIAKVMPLVSQRRAILEKSVTDTIMKVLTPAQIASYKLSSM